MSSHASRAAARQRQYHASRQVPRATDRTPAASSSSSPLGGFFEPLAPVAVPAFLQEFGYAADDADTWSPGALHVGAEACGEHEVIFADGVPVNFGWSRESKEVDKLQKGTHVEVLEISGRLHGGRVRARIKEPAGWVSLRKGEFDFLVKLVAGKAVQASSRKAGAPTLFLEVDGHDELEGHTLYRVSCELAGASEACSSKWKTRKRLASLREDLHDRIKDCLGESYAEHFANTPFALKGGLPGTTSRLKDWFHALATLVNHGKASPTVVALVLQFLDVPMSLPAQGMGEPASDNKAAAEKESPAGKPKVAEQKPAQQAKPPVKEEPTPKAKDPLSLGSCDIEITLE